MGLALETYFSYRCLGILNVTFSLNGNATIQTIVGKPFNITGMLCRVIFQERHANTTYKVGLPKCRPYSYQ